MFNANNVYLKEQIAQKYKNISVGFMYSYTHYTSNFNILNNVYFILDNEGLLAWAVNSGPSGYVKKPQTVDLKTFLRLLCKYETSKK